MIDFEKPSALMLPDLAAATAYALDQLAHELPAQRCYHSLAHTRDEVAVMTAQHAAQTNLSRIDLLLLQTAAYYHDIGFTVTHNDHEAAGIAIAAEVLPRFGYRSSHIQRIAAMIRATRMPQRPHSLAAQILADADLDVLGRDDFLVRNHALRRELAYYGTHFSDADWYRRQLDFIRRHVYWTTAARNLRDATKQHNRERLIALITPDAAGGTA